MSYDDTFLVVNEGKEIRDLAEIRNHVESYYKELFRAEPEGGITLGRDSSWKWKAI
jgi:hypothetical protein